MSGGLVRIDNSKYLKPRSSDRKKNWQNIGVFLDLPVVLSYAL